MAAVGVEAADSLLSSSGVAFFIIGLVIISIFLTSLCSDCTKRSFDLQEPEPDKSETDLVRVVKLEEVARVNPIIDEIQRDEKGFKGEDEGKISSSPWTHHEEEGQNQIQPNEVLSNGVTEELTESDLDDTTVDSSPEEETFTTWRSHLRASKLYQRGASIKSPYDTIYKKHMKRAAGFDLTEATTPVETSAGASTPSSTTPASRTEQRLH